MGTATSTTAGSQLLAASDKVSCQQCSSSSSDPFSHPPTGDLLQLGGSAVFRFNHPQEAKRLRKRHSVSVSCALTQQMVVGGCGYTDIHTQEGLLDHRRLARHHTRPPHSLPTSPHRPGVKSVTVMELQSQAVVQATGRTLSSTALTIPGGSVHLLPEVLLLHVGSLSPQSAAPEPGLLSPPPSVSHALTHAHILYCLSYCQRCKSEG